MAEAGPSGLLLVPNVVTREEEQVILAHVQRDPGHVVAQIHPAREYGWRFLKRGKKHAEYHGVVSLTPDDRLGPLPEWLAHVWSLCVPHIHHRDALDQGPDHVLVNSYPVGDGCHAHVDDVAFWTSWVVGVSLGSGCEMHFRPVGGTELHRVYVPARSMYMMTGDARYKYTHAIPFVACDDERMRDERTSITFRAIAPAYLNDALRAQTTLSQ